MPKTNAQKLASTSLEARATRSDAGARRPIIYSTQSPEEIKRLVVQHYGLDDSVKCTLCCRGVSDTYQVSGPDGQFALKLYRSHWRTREAILGELAALKHLSAKGIEVAKPVSRRDGNLITGVRAPEGSRSAVLFHWASGRAPKYSDATHALQYGRLLARLHTAGDDLPSCNSRPQLDLEYMLERPLTRIRPRLQSLPSVAKSLDALVGRLRARVSDANTKFWDWGFCHGDIWSNNARIDGNHLVLFDFDFCGAGWRLFDLASYRWHACLERIEQPGWEPFLDGYLQVRPIAAESLRSIGLLMILRHLWTTAHWMGLSADFGDSMLPEEYFEDLVPFCEKIEFEIVDRQ